MIWQNFAATQQMGEFSSTHYLCITIVKLLTIYLLAQPFVYIQILYCNFDMIGEK